MLSAAHWQRANVNRPYPRSVPLLPTDKRLRRVANASNANRTKSSRPAPGGITDRWAEPNIPSAATNPSARPASYNPDLTPLPSPLRPHCLAKERLRLWLPANPQPHTDRSEALIPLTDEDIIRIRQVSAKAYADSTIGGYGAGLLVYHVYCDRKGIPEAQRAPVGDLVLSGFIATLAGVYSGKTIGNYVNGV